MIVQILYAVFALALLIAVHEFGHFIVAKQLRVGVLKFSIGFGPKLFGRRVGETEYLVSGVPLGGYVKMVGEDPEEKVEKELEAKSFSLRRVHDGSSRLDDKSRRGEEGLSGGPERHSSR
jgi:regulator of sigma E protease